MLDRLFEPLCWVLYVNLVVGYAEVECYENSVIGVSIRQVFQSVLFIFMFCLHFIQVLMLTL